jgi:hypothetical protein
VPSLDRAIDRLYDLNVGTTPVEARQNLRDPPTT